MGKYYIPTDYEKKLLTQSSEPSRAPIESLGRLSAMVAIPVMIGGGSAVSGAAGSLLRATRKIGCGICSKPSMGRKF